MKAGEVVANRFEVERLAGSGGMATVFRARDLHTGDPVALKILRSDRRDAADRLAQEARLLSLMRHPGIVRYVAHGRAGPDSLFLAMEWLDGETLAERLERGPLKVEESLLLAKRVADILAVAHARRIVHRDVKPSNLFLADRRLDGVRVLDFGIARANAPTRWKGDLGRALGTIGFMAPEQACGKADVDARADVFSLGCVLFSCLTGRPPFTGSDPTAVLAKIVLTDPPSVSALREDVPDGLDELLSRALSKDPRERPADAAAVARELSALWSEEPRTPDAQDMGLTRGERRLVCILLAGMEPPFDTASEAEVPTLRESIREVARAHGALLVRLAEGTVLASLWGRGAATDLASEAARFGLALRDEFPRAPIAMTTGHAVLAGEVPVGEALERAVRLLRLESTCATERNAPRRILVDEVTFRLLDERFDVDEETGVFSLRGPIEPPADPAGRGARLLLGRATPCVGRDGEIAALQETLSHCAEEHVARAVVVTGIAGIGKSRLRYELLRRSRDRVPGLEVWFARGDPLREGASFGMLAQLVWSTAALRDAETPAQRRRKLEARVDRSVSREERERVADFLGELADAPSLGPEGEQLRAARADTVLRGDQIRRAAEDLLEATCAERPVLVILEDLQWGDLPTLTFLDRALLRLAERPLMVLALGRSEVLQRFPGLWASRPTTWIALVEIGPKASARLVRAVLDETVPERVVERLVQESSGHPLHLEELIRAEAEGRGGSPSSTVVAMVQSRLESLPDESRRVLRAASVFGGVFWRGGVTTLLGGRDGPSEVGDVLSDLARAELISERSTTRFRGEPEYVFRHSVVQDAAYAMLTDRDRSTGHRLAAEWLEECGEHEAIVLGEHLERAGETGRAATWYRRAAEQALGANDLEMVLARVDRAIACGATDETLGELLLLRAEAHRWRGDNLGAKECGLVALERLRRGGNAWCHAAGEVAIAATNLSDRETLLTLAGLVRDEVEVGVSPAMIVAAARVAAGLLFTGEGAPAADLLSLVERLGAPADLALPHVSFRLQYARAHECLRRGDVAGNLERMAACVRACDRSGDVRSACVTRITLGYAYSEVGAYERAEGILRDALAGAERLGITSASAGARHNLGIVLAQLGAMDEALDHEQAAIDSYAEHGNVRFEGASRAYLACMLMRAGRPEGAEREARRAVDLLKDAAPLRAFALATLARALLDGGKRIEGLQAATDAMSLIESLGEIEAGDALVRLTHAEALRAMDRIDAARDRIVAASRRLLERAERIADSELRESFLTRVEENARTLELARELGRDDPATS